MKQNKKSKKIESETPHVDQAILRFEELVKPSRVRAR